MPYYSAISAEDMSKHIIRRKGTTDPFFLIVKGQEIKNEFNHNQQAENMCAFNVRTTQLLYELLMWLVIDMLRKDTIVLVEYLKKIIKG